MRCRHLLRRGTEAQDLCLLFTKADLNRLPSLLRLLFAVNSRLILRGSWCQWFTLWPALAPRIFTDPWVAIMEAVGGLLPWLLHRLGFWLWR